MRYGIAVLAFLLWAGCGHKSSGAVEHGGDGTGTGSAAPATAATAVSAGMDMLEHIAAAIAGSESCADKGKALRGWVDASGDEMARVSAKLRAIPEDAIGPEVKTQMDTRPTVKALFETAEGCSSDDTFKDAWQQASAAFEST